MRWRVGRAVVFGFSVALAIGASAPTWADGTTRRVSVGPGGVEGDMFSVGAALSADGRFVAFSSVATNLVPGDTNDVSDAFVRRLAPD